MDLLKKKSSKKENFTSELVNLKASVLDFVEENEKELDHSNEISSDDGSSDSSYKQKVIQ